MIWRSKIPASLQFSAAVVLLLAFAALIFPYAPLEDFPEWIYQGYVFNKLAEGTPSALFEIKHYPVPYALLQLIVSGALLIASPMTASRIVLALYAIISLFAVHRVIARYRIEPLIGWPVLICVVVLNAPFWNGYMGYQSGLIVLLLYLSLPSASRTDPKWVVCFSLLAFFAHGWAFVAFLVFVGIYALYDRRVFACGFALLPSLALLAWYMMNNINHGELVVLSDVKNANIFLFKVYTLLKAAPYHNPIIFTFNAAQHFGYAYLGIGLALNAIFMLSLLAAAIVATRMTGWQALIRKPELLIGTILLALAIVLPPTGFEMANPGERVMYQALIALTIAIFDGVELPNAPKVILTCATLAGMVLFAFGLVAGSEAYNATFASAEAGQTAPLTPLASSSWFSHRLVQFDGRMKHVEAAWKANVMPSLPLEFETGLVSNKTR
jgi:hypothetical protein